MKLIDIAKVYTNKGLNVLIRAENVKGLSDNDSSFHGLLGDVPYKFLDKEVAQIDQFEDITLIVLR